MSDGDHPGAGDTDGSDPGSRRWIEPPSLKDLLADADDTHVLDGLAGRRRLTWDAVTDAGGAPTEADRDAAASASAGESSFRFDLGGALARLARDGAEGDAAASAAPSTERPEEPAAPAVNHAPPSHQAIPSTEPNAEREPFVAPPSAIPPSPSPVTRPIEPMTYESVVREPSTPPVSNPMTSQPPAPDRPPVAQPPMPEGSAIQPPFAEPIPQYDYPRRVPGTHLESQMRPAPEAVPEIREATPTDAAPRPAAHSSVFHDLQTGIAPASAPSLPTAARSAPTAAPVASSGMMPSLPPSNPAAPPPSVEPLSSAPSTPDINALRSAQLRAGKQRRHGKMFGRSLLAFVVIGGMIAAALVFGRSLLFDTEWDAQLTPIVNEIQAERGRFDHPVPLEMLPGPEFGERLRTATIGDGWVARVPEWRALGLATGVVTIESVDAALAQTRTAFYDAESGTIYQRAEVDETDTRADLRVALEQAFDGQTGAAATDADPDSDAGNTDVDDPNAADAEIAAARTFGFTGISPLPVIAARAVDTVVSGSASAELPIGTESLPIPIAYELAAVHLLGEPILLAAGIDPDTLPADMPYPDAIITALDDASVLSPGGILRAGDVALAPPAALGTDDWSLVWSTRLPATTVTTMTELVIADSYRPLDRNGTACFIGVFRTTDAASNGALFAALESWAASAPAASQATATTLDATGVQLEACDPGAEAGIAANPDVVASLINLQRQRLTQ
jgi:hypothetical protein